MAGGWHVLLESDIPGVEVNADAGKALLYYQHQIDSLADDLGLPPLSGFFRPDRAGVAAFLLSQGVEPDEDALPEEEWFEPDDGLVTVRGLLKRLRDDASAVPQGDKVIADLEEIERALVPAEKNAIRFRLTRILPSLAE
jgi:hypothetical protein